jgi:sugar/nucleoside kinase (ribokinase family)
MIVWSRENGMFSVPAYETLVRDPTGAGDALAGSFLVTWVRTNDLLWSAAVGSAVASMVVAKKGLARFGKRRQIERRATEILDQITRI